MEKHLLKDFIYIIGFLFIQKLGVFYAISTCD